jgi:hypothetical protein
MLVPLASGNAFYMPSVNATPTAWDLYSLPYYHCRIRITISGTNSNLNYFNGVFQTTGSSPGLVGAITVTISYLPDNAQQPDAVFGVPDTAPGWTTVTYTQVSNASNSASPGALTNTSTGLTANFLLYTSTATDTVDASASADTQDSNVLEIDLLQMYAALGLDPKYYYSIYIGCNPVQPPNGANNNYPGIVIKDADDLTGATARVRRYASWPVYQRFIDCQHSANVHHRRRKRDPTARPNRFGVQHCTMASPTGP